MSDSDMNVKSFDSDKDDTSGLHARSKRSERSVSDTDDEIAMLLNPERMESIRRGVEQSKAGEVTRYPADHFRQAYIDTYGVAPEDDTPDYCMVNGCECEVPDTITITISRATAEGWITEAYDTTDRKAVLVALACRAALEGER